MRNSMSPSPTFKPILHQSGIFLSVCGVGGLLSIWAVQSVYSLTQYEPWAGGMALLLGVGLFFYSQTHPSRGETKVFG